MATVSQGTVNIIRQREQEHCWYCGKDLSDAQNGFFTRITVDHVVPRSKGGSDAVNNLVLSCPRCNLLKNDLSLDEFRDHVQCLITSKTRELSWLRKIHKNLNKRRF